MGGKKTIELVEASPRAFEVYIHWLYTQILDTDGMPTSRPLPETQGGGFTSSKNLVKLWVLGNFLNDEPFMNLVIDHMLKKSDSDRKLYNTSTLQYAWENTPAGCALQRLMVDVLVARIKLSDFDRDKNDYPNEVLVELARKYVSKERVHCPGFVDRCDYHVHKDGGMRCIDPWTSEH